MPVDERGHRITARLHAGRVAIGRPLPELLDGVGADRIGRAVDRCEELLLQVGPAVAAVGLFG